jgi:PleD family two-component response regulator
VAHSGEATSLEELIRLADIALFQGKREGRNRVARHIEAEPEAQATEVPAGV